MRIALRISTMVPPVGGRRIRLDTLLARFRRANVCIYITMIGEWVSGWRGRRRRSRREGEQRGWEGDVGGLELDCRRRRRFLRIQPLRRPPETAHQRRHIADLAPPECLNPSTASHVKAPSRVRGSRIKVRKIPVRRFNRCLWEKFRFNYNLDDSTRFKRKKNSS